MALGEDTCADADRAHLTHSTSEKEHPFGSRSAPVVPPHIIIIIAYVRSDGRLHGAAVEVGVLSTDAVLGVLVGVQVVLLVEIELIVPQLGLPVQLVPALAADHVVATDASERGVGVARLLLLLLLLVMLALVLLLLLEGAVVAARGLGRVVARAVELVDAQHLDLLLLEPLLLVAAGVGLRVWAREFGYSYGWAMRGCVPLGAGGSYAIFHLQE